MTAIVNTAGNALLLALWPGVFDWLGVPAPTDLYTFYTMSGLSFTMGVLAFIVWRNPLGSTRLLVVGMAGKGSYALMTFYFYVFQDLHWFWLGTGIWDAAYTLIFYMYLIHLLRRDLLELNMGELRPGLGQPRTGNALLLYYSLSGNGTRAISAVRRGLTAMGYTCVERNVQPLDQELYSFPFRSFWHFWRVALRSIFRIPARIEPLDIAPDHPYDLIVCETQTWMAGMSNVMEAVFRDPANRLVFQGHDVAAVNVCRGLWRRAQCQLVTWLQRSGGHIVGASPHENPGREPARLFSLFIFLGKGRPFRPGWLSWFLTPQYLSEHDLHELERFGEALATRPMLNQPPARSTP